MLCVFYEACLYAKRKVAYLTSFPLPMSRLLILTILLSLAVTPTVSAQDDEQTILVLRPYCTSKNLVECPDFEVEDPQTLRTPVLKVGGRITMNLMIKNPSEHTLGK